MTRLAIVGGRILTPDEIVEQGVVLISDGKIEALDHSDALGPLTDVQRLDAQGKIVVPGYIDGHTHGAIGFDYMDASQDELAILLGWLPSTGVTSVLPTIASALLEDQLAMAARLCQFVRRRPPGTNLLGVHSEGPYLSIEKRGVQPVEALRLPQIEEVAALIEASERNLKMMTLAPELPGAEKLIRYLVENGIVASAGHTNASYEEFAKAVDAGLSRAAHLFNGMPPLHHRNPGPVGAALTRSEVFVEVILDGVHLHPAVVQAVLRIKRVERVTLISDSMQATGLTDGEYLRPGNRKVIVKQGVARNQAGNLAGSVLTMDQAVRNAVTLLGLSLQDAVRLCTQTAAASLGIAAHKGSLEVGKDADIVILDSELGVHTTLVGGEVRFQSHHAAIQHSVG